MRDPSPCWHRNLGEASQSRGLSQTYKRDEGFVQEIHLTDQDVGRFGVARDLLHELVFQLVEEKSHDLSLQLMCDIGL